MEASYREFNAHLLDINLDFKENVIKKVHTVKLNDQDMLNKKVEELKIQEGKELGLLNKTYNKIDSKYRKVERKNERFYNFKIKQF